MISIPKFNQLYKALPREHLDDTSAVHSLAGRIRNIRESSRKLCFVDLEQEGRKAQVILSQHRFPSSMAYEATIASIRRGDIIGTK